MKRRVFAKSERFRSALVGGEAPAAHGDGPAGRGSSSSENSPKLARRHANKHSRIKSGRTIGERREKLETANERLAARKKVKKRQNLRVIITVIIFIALIVVAAFFIIKFLRQQEAHEDDTATTTVVKNYAPTIEVVDENAASGQITGRMSDYIGQAEADFRDLGYTPLRAVIPAGSIREVDFYLDGYAGFIKTTIDRGTGVTVEDADRMLRYLAGIEKTDFVYIDVRIDGKAYWK